MMKNRIPPPIWMFICGCVAYVIDILIPGSMGGESERILLSGVCVLVAVVFLSDSVLGFIRSKTTVNPLQPQKASTLVISGVYRISRNPMYLGMLLFLCAWALYIGNPLSGVGAVLFGVVMNVFQIAPEEKVLSEKFCKAYLDYCSKVRRWI